MPATAFPEKSVVEIWQHDLPGRTDLVTEEGEGIDIVYPGMINGDRGADLVDAVISTENKTLRGNIEVHVKSSSWWSHGHHEDPVYNDVVLHVVYCQDKKEAVNLQNGRTIPTLVLEKYLKSRAGPPIFPESPDIYCALPCRSPGNPRKKEFIGEIIDKAGEERFLNRVASFRERLAKTRISQALYEAVMESLGYAKNKSQMVELAQYMPLERLETEISEISPDTQNLARLQALLLGTAGLLPSQHSDSRRQDIPDDSRVDRLERLWSSSGVPVAMNRSGWYFFKVRPGNITTRRIAAMSYLLLRCQQWRILENPVNDFCRKAAEKGYHELEQVLYVPASGYWADYLDFGLPGRKNLPALLGKGRAADIIINVLLPLALIQAERISSPEMAQQILEIYHHYPRLMVNHIERHMCNQLGIHSHLVNSARRQQGLIHIYRTLCSEGKCHDCPLGAR
jgi:hypothetical protein